MLPVHPSPTGDYRPIADRALAFALQLAGSRSTCPTCGRELWRHWDCAAGTDVYYCPACKRPAA